MPTSRPMMRTSQPQDSSAQRPAGADQLPQSAEGLRRLLMLHAGLADIYALMLQADDRATLFHETCRILVQGAALPAASICVIDESSGALATVAAAGERWEGPAADALGSARAPLKRAQPANPAAAMSTVLPLPGQEP